MVFANPDYAEEIIEEPAEEIAETIDYSERFNAIESAIADLASALQAVSDAVAIMIQNGATVSDLPIEEDSSEDDDYIPEFSEMDFTI